MKKGELIRLMFAKQYMPADVLGWLSSPAIQAMDIAQEGAFWRLLMTCWAADGFAVNGDDETLATITKLGKDWRTKGPRVLKQFQRTDDGKITHRKLHKLWEMVLSELPGKRAVKAASRELSALKENARDARSARARYDARSATPATSFLSEEIYQQLSKQKTPLAERPAAAARVYEVFCKAAKLEPQAPRVEEANLSIIIARLATFTEWQLVQVVRVANWKTWYVENGYNRKASTVFRNDARVQDLLNEAHKLESLGSRAEARERKAQEVSSESHILGLLEGPTTNGEQK